MPYDGPMLAANVVSALTNIPSFIREIRDLLSGGKGDNQNALAKLDALKSALIDFCHTEAWLEEAKVLHELLQRLDNQLEDSRHEYQRAIESGQFVAQQYRMNEIQRCWFGIKIDTLAKVISKAKVLEHIELSTLKLDESGNAIEGPAWAIRFVELTSEVDKAVEDYNNRVNMDSKIIADLINQFNMHVKSQMALADERIRKEAVSFGQELHKLSGVLEAI